MSTAFISEWASFTDNKVAVTGATAQYGGPTDWLKYWAINKAAGTDLTTFFLSLRDTAPGTNYTALVDTITDNDLPLLQQDNATTQPTQYPGTVNPDVDDLENDTWTWNGYAWVFSYA